MTEVLVAQALSESRATPESHQVRGDSDRPAGVLENPGCNIRDARQLQ
jgi:hypothetical protein